MVDRTSVTTISLFQHHPFRVVIRWKIDEIVRGSTNHPKWEVLVICMELNLSVHTNLLEEFSSARSRLRRFWPYGVKWPGSWSAALRWSERAKVRGDGPRRLDLQRDW